MAKLAIKGHKTRGKEVIEILEMLGGKSKYELLGNSFISVYFIEDGEIMCELPIVLENIKQFTLEEFLEKFPYKVGDNVSSKYLKNYKIEKMEWDATNNKVIYKLQGMGWYNTNELKPYKEKDMETITIDDFKANTKEWLIDKLESMSKDNALQTINNIYDELHKPKYPKTYEECCMVLQDACMTHKGGYKSNLIQTFQKLLVCRDAYWKIYGEEVGLDGPWEPDWKDGSDKYFICYLNDKLWMSNIRDCNRFLVFPTEEIRDAYKENFDKDIEICKEFL